MGSSSSKNNRNPYEKDVRGLKKKIRLMENEINEMMIEREKESRAYERDVMVFAFKEAEWKQEKKRLGEEVKSLENMLEEKEEREKDDEMVGKKGGEEWQLLGTNVLVEQIKEERARRDEAVEKWKQLYLAIKTELDDLIQRTHQGERLYWKAEEEDAVEELQRELKAKEETIELLKAQLASKEKEEYKREREVDILRQSLRIMSNKKATSITKTASKSLHY
ncbi:hypothetical protein L1049_016112 [Liquidambar formosana]|uniref:Uncharacterized protein n=1 Tax=Liquidambar formosana TaxID=63359 RepID=A0AAP0S542_LIQFO